MAVAALVRAWWSFPECHRLATAATPGIASKLDTRSISVLSDANDLGSGNRDSGRFPVASGKSIHERWKNWPCGRDCPQGVERTFA